MGEHGPLSDAFLADDASFVIPVRLMEMAEDRGLMQATITQTLEAVFAEIDSLRAPGADLYEAVLDAVRTEPLLGCGCCADYSEVRCEHGYVVHSDEADEAGDYCNPGDRRELIARRIAERLGAFEDRTGQTRQALELAEATLAAARALCRQAERNYGGPVSMARVEAWVHLGALRTVLDRYPLPEETS